MIDLIDKKILIELSRNCRESFTQISKRLRISKDVMNYRVKRLEEKKIITGYYTVIDYSKLGYYSYRILIKLNKFNEKFEKSLVEYFKQFKTVNFLATIADDFDLLINFNERNPLEFFEKYQDIIHNFSEHILKKEFNIVTSIHHFEAPLIEGQKHKLYITGKQKEIVKLNETEKALLQNLTRNSRISYAELSNSINKKSNTLIYSLKKLEYKKVILGYQPKINWNYLGYTHYKVFLQLQNIDKKMYSHICQSIADLPFSIYITEVMGSQDLEFEIICKNHLELINNLKNLTNKFSEQIKLTQTLIALNVHHINYLPIE